MHNIIEKLKRQTTNKQKPSLDTCFTLLQNWGESLAMEPSATQLITIVVVIVCVFRENPKLVLVIYYLSVISAGKYITMWQGAMLKQTALRKSEK